MVRRGLVWKSRGTSCLGRQSRGVSWDRDAAHRKGTLRSGSSGSVVARRLAENPDVSVLLLEAGGSDESPSVLEAARWFENLGSERDWKFVDQPNPHIKGRSMPLGMGKVLGGGSSINGLGWARGHKNDWDFFASESGDTAWNYESVLNIYRRMEDWQGAPDPTRRGTGGLVFVQSAPDPNPIAPAMVDAARSIGMRTFDSNNGRMMEGAGGASIIDVRVRDGKRLSVFRSYVFPYMDRPNLTVLTHALVTKLTLEGKRATGVEIALDGKIQRFTAGLETYTPALLQMELPDSTWNEIGVGQITKRYIPLGVVAAISAWNIPFLLSFTKVLPALLTGNIVVLKPAVFTPL